MVGPDLFREMNKPPSYRSGPVGLPLLQVQVGFIELGERFFVPFEGRRMDATAARSVFHRMLHVQHFME
jgi:hypothetical protein